MTRERFEAQRGPLGAMLVGEPDEVAEKVLPGFAKAIASVADERGFVKTARCYSAGPFFVPLSIAREIPMRTTPRPGALRPR